MEDHLYCQIFVEAELDQESLVALIASAVGREVGVGEQLIEADFVSIDCVRNHDAHLGAYRPTRSSFMYSKYYLDIEPTENASREDYRGQVDSLLSFLWIRGFGAVAACDFEDELMYGGGIERLTGP